MKVHDPRPMHAPFAKAFSAGRIVNFLALYGPEVVFDSSTPPGKVAGGLSPSEIRFRSLSISSAEP